MLKDDNRGRKFMALIIGAVLMVIVLRTIVLEVIVNRYGLEETTIGKMIYIEFENGAPDYLEMLLESENHNKLKFFDKKEVQQLIQYMRDNNIRIVSGQYKIPQTSSSEEMINILEFEKID